MEGIILSLFSIDMYMLWPLLELSYQNGSNNGSQHIFSIRNKVGQEMPGTGIPSGNNR